MPSDLSALPIASSILIVTITALALIAAQFVGRRIARLVRSTTRLGEGRRQQLLTLIQISRWIGMVLIGGSGLLMLLSAFDVDITPLLASVGVAGLAVSLGLQTLIKDLVSGLLILVENQYVIGDVIQVGGVSGQVERMTLRATHLRGLDGVLHIIPNGEIRVVSNKTKEWSRAVVDLGVAYEQDPIHVERVLQEAAGAFAQEPAYRDMVLEAPDVMVPVSLGDWAYTARVRIKTRPGKQWEIARALRRHLLATCARDGITLPYPRQEVWTRPSGFDEQDNNPAGGTA